MNDGIEGTHADVARQQQLLAPVRVERRGGASTSAGLGMEQGDRAGRGQARGRAGGTAGARPHAGPRRRRGTLLSALLTNDRRRISLSKRLRNPFHGSFGTGAAGRRRTRPPCVRTAPWAIFSGPAPPRAFRTAYGQFHPLRTGFVTPARAVAPALSGAVFPPAASHCERSTRATFSAPPAPPPRTSTGRSS